MQKMYLFITITQRDDSDEFTNFFNSKDVSVIYSTPCEGTVRQKTLSLFGLEETLKTVHYCVVTANKKNELIKTLTREMAIDLPNRGIAVAIPLTSMGGKRALEMYANGHENDIEEEQIMQEKQMELIVAICEKGHTETVMDAARSAGARGGTVVRAKGTGSKYTSKFFGISIAEEKEMIYIVASAEQKRDIMQAIMDNAGIDSEAHTIVFSLPVSDTAGLRIFDQTI
ncbi:MAG: P-II family nitrogen regulator [Clostridia bacterium]|nr:P-II family nitrogen regulator [Clostridia bacterium]